jgi:hypothetical protein
MVRAADRVPEEVSGVGHRRGQSGIRQPVTQYSPGTGHVLLAELHFDLAPELPQDGVAMNGLASLD